MLQLHRAAGTCKHHAITDPHLVQDDSRVEDVVRVKELLEIPHEAICLATPFHLNEWRHVPAGAMLTLHDHGDHQHADDLMDPNNAQQTQAASRGLSGNLSVCQEA